MKTKHATSSKGSKHDLSIFRARFARLRARLRKIGIEHFFVTNPLDVGYLTGFLGGDSFLLVSPKACAIVSDFRYQEELEEVAPLCDIIIRKGSMTAAVAELLRREGVKELHVQAETMTLAERAAYGAAWGKGFEKRLVPCSGVIAAMRAIKDDAEVALIRKAVRIQEEALLATLPTIRPGMSELEVAATLEAEMKRRGSSAPGFQTIVAADPNGSLPHYRPQRHRLRANRAVLIDWGAIWKGYHSDMTRVFALGKWPAKVAEIYQIVLDAKEKAAAALAPGRTTREIDAIARDHIARHGYGEHFGHGLGHGLGFNGHEDPRITHMLGETKLMPGHVVTIEPGIYLPGIGGVRLEDDYVITAKGAKNLCSLPQDLKWATLG